MTLLLRNEEGIFIGLFLDSIGQKFHSDRCDVLLRDDQLDVVFICDELK